MKSKKRNIISFIPQDGFFKTAFVIGQKATDQIMKSAINTTIKKVLQKAKVYAEERGIRDDVKNDEAIEDIIKLIQIELDF